MQKQHFRKEERRLGVRISPTTLQPRVILPIAHYWVEMMHPDSLR
jgi:hypothetical protein